MSDDPREAKWRVLNERARQLAVQRGNLSLPILHEAALFLEERTSGFPSWTGRGGVYSMEQMDMIELYLNAQLVLGAL